MNVKMSCGNRMWLRILLVNMVLLPTLFLSGQAKANKENIYTVAKFLVQADAKNAVAAKKKAIAQGKRDAFHYLLRRLTGYSSQTRLPPFSDRSIERLITGLSVRDERNSRVRYVARMDFNFDAKAVKRLLKSYTIPVVEEQATKTVILPIYIDEDDGKQARRNDRSWRNAWTKMDLVNTLTPVKLAHITPEVTPKTVTEVMNGNTAVFSKISRGYRELYKANSFILAVAVPDKSKGSIVVTLTGQDAAGAFNLKRSYQTDITNIGVAAREASFFSLRVLEGRWKLLYAGKYGDTILSAAPENFEVTVIFSGLPQWKSMRGKLSDIPGVDGLEVGALSARGAEITLNFPGGATGFASQLASRSMELKNVNGAWVLSNLVQPN